MKIIQNLFRKLMPREEKFFDLLGALHDKSVEAAVILNEMVKESLPISIAAKKIKQIEEEADCISHEIIDKALGTFVTPIDRDDLKELSAKMDDIIDDIEKFSRNLEIYQMIELSQFMKEMAKIILSQVEEIGKALKNLRELTRINSLLITKTYTT